MIINDAEVSRRLNSPMNLINRLKTISQRAKKAESAMAIFGLRPEGSKRRIEAKEPLATSSEVNPQQPTLDAILENSESKIKLGLAHDNALDLLVNSVNMLSNKLDEINPSKLPAVVAAASKTVESIRKERNESAKLNKDREVHYHFYTPEQRKVESYEVVEVQ